jgi:hypothetical protein
LIRLDRRRYTIYWCASDRDCEVRVDVNEVDEPEAYEVAMSAKVQVLSGKAY